MNSKNNFLNYNKKEQFSTPKFPLIKSYISSERDEKTLRPLKKNINNILDKNEINKEKKENDNNENNDIENRNKLKSLLDSINDKNDFKDLLINQFSFDGKIQNDLIKNNENNINKDDINNNIIIINNNDENNEIKYINDPETYFLDSNKNIEENNFKYNLPLESDKSSEKFNLFSFQGNSKEMDDKQASKNKIQNQKRNNPEIINEKREINLKGDKLAPIQEKKFKKFNSNIHIGNIKMKINNKSNENNASKNDPSKNKRNYHIKVPTLNEIYSYNNSFSEPNKTYYYSKNMSYSKKNEFSSHEKNTENIKKDNKLKVITKPFILEKLDNNKNYFKNSNINKDNVNNNKITKNIIEDITVSYYKKINKNNKNSPNSKRNNKFIEIPNNNFKNEVIYEKNIVKDNSSIINNKKTPKSFFNSINNSNINKTNYTFNDLTFKKKKNILRKNNIEHLPSKIRKKFYKEIPFSPLDSSSLKKIKEGKINEDFPLYNSQIINQNILFKNYIYSKSSSVKNKKNIINLYNKENEDNKTSIVSNDKFTNNISNDYKYKKLKINVNKNKRNKVGNYEIKVNTINNNFNINSLYDNNYDTDINENKNSIKEENTKGFITERNKDLKIWDKNIYSKKKIIFNNYNNNNSKNKYFSINNEKSKNYRRLKYFNPQIYIEDSYSTINNENQMVKSEQNSNNNSLSVKDKNKLQNEVKTKNDINLKVDFPASNGRNIKKNFYKRYYKTRNMINLSNTNLSFNTEKNKLSSRKNIENRPIINYNNNTSKNSKIINSQYETINNSLYLGNNKNLLLIPKINKDNPKIPLSSENSFETPNFRKNIIKYNILRNNKNNQVSSEVSVFIGNNSSFNNSNSIETNENKINDENNKKKIGKFPNGDKINPINVNKKTIINFNQFYPSYYINNKKNLSNNKENKDYMHKKLNK